MLKNMFLIGEIKAVDSDGFFTIISYSDRPERFRDLRSVMLEIFGVNKELFIEESIVNTKNILLKFRNFDSDEDAKHLLGKKLYVQPDEAIELQEDEYFIHDLIGSEVYRNDKPVGNIKDVMSLPANDVLVIESVQGEELLIPLIKDYVQSFNYDEKRLILNPGNSDIYDDEN